MLRGFTDSRGVEWRVWEVFPSAGRDTTNAKALSRTAFKDSVFANGWLCFEAATEKRRLAPIPTGWATSESTTLEELRNKAAVVPPRRYGRAS